MVKNKQKWSYLKYLHESLLFVKETWVMVKNRQKWSYLNYLHDN